MNTRNIKLGAYGGLAGGVVFGAMMALMGMLPMIGQMVGHPSAVTGFLAHLVISALIGASFAVLFRRFLHGLSGGLGYGLVYGGAWWFLGPLTLMPLMMGMGLGVNWNAAAAAQMLPSLGGHLIYGAILGLSYAWLQRKIVKRVKPNSLYSGTKRTLVPEELGEFRTEGEPIAVPMNFEFLLENSKGPGKRQAPTGGGAEAVAVPMNLGFLTKPTEIAGKRRVPSSLIAVGFHALVLVGALLVPLWYTEALQVHQVMKVTRLVAPPPPPLSAPPRLAPAPATRRAVPTRRTKPVILTLTRKLVRPTAIPHEIAQNFEPVVVELGGSGAPGEIPDGILGGVPGGVPGGQLGGVIGGVLGGIPTAVPPPVEIDEPQGPVRLNSFSQLQRVKYVYPHYPPAAFAARIQGDVRIVTNIDTNGRVVELKLVAGHPLLVSAAMHAVKKWIYEPFYLNGRPVPVEVEITVKFRLG